MKLSTRRIFCLLLLACTGLVGCKQESPKQEASNNSQKVQPVEEATTEAQTPVTDQSAQKKEAENNGVAAKTKDKNTENSETDEKKDGTATANAAAEPTTCGGATKAAESGCGGSVEAKTDTPSAPAGKQHFGGKFTLTDEPVAVSAIIEKAADFSGKNIKVSARIAKVCRKKGCWMTLQPEAGGDQYVRVTMKDYGFFVPVDCDGKTATVEGTFKSVELPEAQRKHLAEDGGDDPNAIKGKAMELSLVATAIDIE